MPQRRVQFTHDGHRFDAEERVTPTPGAPADAEPQITWVVRMDDAPALEFRGEYPYRDDDLRKRIVEWYDIQRPRA